MTTYEAVMDRAEKSVDLSALGIEGLRFRTARTGGRVLEVAGANKGHKADELAAKLRATIGDVARVSPPELCAEMRISGLGDAATSQAVAAQVAKVGGCPESGVKVGVINRPPGRQGTVWVKCPVMAAKKIVVAGRFTV
ncbi:PREDICTED: uncharacterized protein LOC106118397, partial [Papilio xuthus]|uniref:Uncharacterized protein LOC106118397 n=1 Tax=Papilio xuthus TaxID=66420 RepID=A0AAJ6ZAL5_PAPXU